MNFIDSLVWLKHKHTNEVKPFTGILSATEWAKNNLDWSLKL